MARGSWRGVFGGQGYAMAGDAAGESDMGTGVDRLVPEHGTGPDRRQTPRAVASGRQRSPGGLLVSPWAFTVDVNVVDGATHQVALYMIDWDLVGTRTTGRRARRRDRRGARHPIDRGIPERAVSRVDGERARELPVDQHGGPNAVLSGVFFD